MKRIILGVVVGVLAAAGPASAQTDWHIYGGGVLGGEEYTRGALFGIGSTTGPVFVGVDGHALWYTDEGIDFLAQAVPRGLTFEVTTAGLDVAVGGVVRSATRRVDFIPHGIIGYTTGEVEICDGSFCDDDSVTDANFGAGFIAAFKGESGRGLHTGFRWTRNYGAAVSVGFVFQTGN